MMDYHMIMLIKTKHDLRWREFLIFLSNCFLIVSFSGLIASTLFWLEFILVFLPLFIFTVIVNFLAISSKKRDVASLCSNLSCGHAFGMEFTAFGDGWVHFVSGSCIYKRGEFDALGREDHLLYTPRKIINLKEVEKIVILNHRGFTTVIKKRDIRKLLTTIEDTAV